VRACGRACAENEPSNFTGLCLTWLSVCSDVERTEIRPYPTLLNPHPRSHYCSHYYYHIPANRPTQTEVQTEVAPHEIITTTTVPVARGRTGDQFGPSSDNADRARANDDASLHDHDSALFARDCRRARLYPSVTEFFLSS